jgi:hypothetical protein
MPYSTRLYLCLAAQGLQGLAFLAAQGLQGLAFAFLAAQGLQGLAALAAQGLQGLAFLASAAEATLIGNVNVAINTRTASNAPRRFIEPSSLSIGTYPVRQ